MLSKCSNTELHSQPYSLNRKYNIRYKLKKFRRIIQRKEIFLPPIPSASSSLLERGKDLQFLFHTGTHRVPAFGGTCGLKFILSEVVTDLTRVCQLEGCSRASETLRRICHIQRSVASV
jgi:hypothetical protein